MDVLSVWHRIRPGELRMLVGSQQGDVWLEMLPQVLPLGHVTHAFAWLVQSKGSSLKPAGIS